MEPTCLKSPENPYSIDLILTSRPRSFENSCAIETGRSDFHKMTFTVMKKSLQKYKPEKTKFWDYKHFQNNILRGDLLSELFYFNIK